MSVQPPATEMPVIVIRLNAPEDATLCAVLPNSQGKRGAGACNKESKSCRGTPPRAFQPYQSYTQAATGFPSALLEIGSPRDHCNPMASPKLPSLMSAQRAQSTSGFSPRAAKSGTHHPFESLGP